MWLKIAKKGSGVPSLTADKAVPLLAPEPAGKRATAHWRASRQIFNLYSFVQMLLQPAEGVGKEASELLARKRPRLVPMTDEIFVARGVVIGQAWRALRSWLQGESLPAGHRGAPAAAGQNRERAPAA